MTENEISKIVVNIAYQIHVELGPGLFESVYEEVLHYEVLQTNLYVQRQKDIPIYWKDLKMEQGFRADIIIENKVIVEIKSIEKLAPVHHKHSSLILSLLI